MVHIQYTPVSAEQSNPLAPGLSMHLLAKPGEGQTDCRHYICESYSRRILLFIKIITSHIKENIDAKHKNLQAEMESLKILNNSVISHDAHCQSLTNRMITVT